LYFSLNMANSINLLTALTRSLSEVALTGLPAAVNIFVVSADDLQMTGKLDAHSLDL